MDVKGRKRRVHSPSLGQAELKKIPSAKSPQRCLQETPWEGGGCQKLLQPLGRAPACAGERWGRKKLEREGNLLRDLLRQLGGSCGRVGREDPVTTSGRVHRQRVMQPPRSSKVRKNRFIRQQQLPWHPFLSSPPRSPPLKGWGGGGGRGG